MISEAELAISKISSFKALGLSDLRQLGFPEEERAGLVAVASQHLDKLKEIELRQARQIKLSTGEQAIEIAPFPEAYATWRSQLLADTEAIVDPVDSLIAVAAIENEFGHGAGFGLTTRRLWVTAHPESSDCYILRTQFVDESDEQTRGWTQTFIGAKAPSRYVHLFSDAEAFKAEQGAAE